MNSATVSALKEEAYSKYLEAKRRFEQYDNIDDMHEMNNWRHTFVWLSAHLNRLTKRRV